MGTWSRVGLVLLGVAGATQGGFGGDAAGATRGAPTLIASALRSTPTTTPESTSVPATTAGSDGSAAEVLFEDPFDDDRNEWGVVEDPQYGSAAFDDGDYVWEFRGSVAHWLPAVLGGQFDRGELDMRDVVVHAELTILDGDGVAGVFCRENPDTDAEWQWYEFVARDGYAAIRQSDLEANIDVLAETDDVSLPVGEPIVIDATCVDDADGDAQLSLAVNGTSVIHATDDAPLENGVPGLQAWTFPVHEQINIRWHEFSVTQAEA